MLTEAFWPTSIPARSLSTTSVVTWYVVEAMTMAEPAGASKPGRMLTSVTTPAIGALSEAALDLLLDRPARLERLGVLVLGAVERQLCLAFRVGVVGVLRVREGFLGDLDIDVGGADIGRRPLEVRLEVGGVSRRERVALRDGVADLRGHLGHRPRGLARRGGIVVTQRGTGRRRREAVRFRGGERSSGGHVVGDVTDGRGGGQVLRAGGGIRAQPAERHGQRPDADRHEHDQHDKLELHLDPFPTSGTCVDRRRGGVT